MDKLIADIADHAQGLGLTPQRMLRLAIDAEWGRWRKWQARTASPTMIIVDRIYAWMRENPVPRERDAA